MLSTKLHTQPRVLAYNDLTAPRAGTKVCYAGLELVPRFNKATIRGTVWRGGEVRGERSRYSTTEIVDRQKREERSLTAKERKVKDNILASKLASRHLGAHDHFVCTSFTLLFVRGVKTLRLSTRHALNTKAPSCLS